MGIFRKILLSALVLTFLPSFVYAEISQFSFTTEPQAISPNTLSGIITVQAQNSSGAGESGTTWYVTITSSSATGQFFSNTTGGILSVPVTMASNSKNKNFYYQDSTVGTHTIKVSVASEKYGSEVFTASQDIVVGVSDGGDSTATSTEDTTTTPTTSSNSNQNSSNTVTISTHYVATPLTAVESDTKFAVGAGRNRLSTVGAPLEFRAESNKETNRQTIFKWSFGDGMVGNGEVTSHSYLYPGEYVVVLNASGPDGQAVSRTNARIVPSELSVSLASPERIEITNNSSNEANLWGRAMVVGSKIFVFPQDTIIKAGQKISFGANVTGLNPAGPLDVSLVIVGTEIHPQEVIVKIAEQKSEQIAQIQSRLSILQKQLIDLSSRQKSENSQQAAQKPPIEERKVENVVETKDGVDIQQSALVLDSVPAVKSGKMEGWLESLKKFLFRTQ